MRLTKEQANEVYDILMAYCDADERGRASFVYNIPRGCREFRCCHALGFGGKFRPFTMTVDCYIEDLTSSRELIIATTNRLLSELAEKFSKE